MNKYVLRLAVLLVISVTVVAILGACEAEPTPTPTPLPTATPTSTPTPEPTPTPDPAPQQPMGGVPLGSDIVAMLPQSEVDCIRGAIGEQFFGVLLQTPFTPELLTAESPFAAPVTACLSAESQALIVEQTGGAAPPAVPTPVIEATAEPMMEEPMEQAPLGADVMAMLPPSEVECIRGALGEEFYNLLLQTPFTPELLAAESPFAAPVTACLSAESQALIAAGGQPTIPPTPEPTEESMTGEAPLGADVMAMLPEMEVQCIRGTIGEMAYNTLLQTPFTPDLLAAESPFAQPVTACLSPESLALIAQATAGGG